MSETQIATEEIATGKVGDKVDLTKLIKTKFSKKAPCPEFVKSLKDQVIKQE